MTKPTQATLADGPAVLAETGTDEMQPTSAPRKPALQRPQLPGWSWSLLSLVIFVVLWELGVRWSGIQPFLLPSPTAVVARMGELIANGRLPRHTLFTFSEVIAGLFFGSLIALPLGYLITISRWAERLITPYLIASQAIPIIAIAPLLTIWIQSTYWSRVVVATIVVFFPLLVNVVVGLRGVSPDMRDLLITLKATRWQIFHKLELPATLPVLLGGFKVAATLSVIGALVGEFVQPRSQGLGYLLLTARYQFKTDEVFVVLITLATLALTLYAIVAMAEKRLLRWQQVA